jgi:hypothetical protein
MAAQRCLLRPPIAQERVVPLSLLCRLATSVPPPHYDRRAVRIPAGAQA